MFLGCGSVHVGSGFGPHPHRFGEWLRRGRMFADQLRRACSYVHRCEESITPLRRGLDVVWRFGVVTQCQAEIITWFLQFAAMKYSLESFHDYLQPDNTAKDPGCPSIDSAKGVTLPIIQKAYPTLF